LKNVLVSTNVGTYKKYEQIFFTFVDSGKFKDEKKKNEKETQVLLARSFEA